MKALAGVTVAGLFFTVTGFGSQLDRWETVSFDSPPYLNLLDVAYGGGRFVAVGESSGGVEGEIFTSPDGAHWTRRSPGVRGQLFGVTYGIGGFVIVGGGWEGDNAVDIILTSADGINWTRRSANLPNHLFGVSYSNNGFVAAGMRGAITTSGDGVAWFDRSLPLDPGLVLRRIAFGGANRVIVGSTIIPYQGVVVTSIDGVQWSRRALATSPLRGISYGNGHFVAVGENDAILRSTNGATWTASASGINGHHFAILFHDGAFIAVGYPGTVISSVDGANWQVHRRGLETLDGIAYGNGSYVAVDYDGVILRSRPPNRPPVAVVAVSPAAQFFSAPPEFVVISPNGEDATVTLSGAGSYDPDGDLLSFRWLRQEADGSLGEFAQGPGTMLVLPLGEHNFVLRVSDGIDEDSTSFEVHVISASQAVGMVIALVETSALAKAEKQALLNMLRSAQRSFDNGQVDSGLRHLAQAQQWIDARLVSTNPELARSLTLALNAIRAMN
jgi:hypothetical protein